MAKQHIHILGICGTFMGGIAQIARALGHQVSGSDVNIYPPMSDHLRNAGIDILPGYDQAHLDPRPDVILIGNALSRGNPCVEHVLDHRLVYQSGPQWLAENVLNTRHVLAVAGTHGKTTTTSMLTWILHDCGYEPGYLIGGVAHDFDKTASLGQGNYFVIEADEYDTAFFDKRSKFIHYRPSTLIINNLEYDHADIFDNLAAIETQFHHLIRIIPANGNIIYRANDDSISSTIARGCWTPRESFGPNSTDWRIAEFEPPSESSEQFVPDTDVMSYFQLSTPNSETYVVGLNLIGAHNAQNATAAIAAATKIGIEPQRAIEALRKFQGVKRRLEKIAEINGVTIFDDFAHHPTAIAATLEAMQNVRSNGRIHCILEPRSNTMRMGIHKQSLAESLNAAHFTYLYQADDLGWDLSQVVSSLGSQANLYADVNDIIAALLDNVSAGDRVVIMSNGGFDNIHERLLAELSK